MGTSPESALASFDLDLLLGPASASISENTELGYKLLDTEKFETTHYGYQAQTNKKSETNYPNQNSEILNYDFLAQNNGTRTEYQYRAENLSNGLTTNNHYQIQDTGNEFSLQVDVVSKSEHAALENKFVQLSNNYVSLKNDYDARNKDYAKVQRQFAHLGADYAQLHARNKEHAMECLNVTSKCQELEKKILNYQASLKASQELCNKLDLDIYAQSRQFVQYQSLVDELQTINKDLETEIKNEKLNGRDGGKMIKVLTNNNKTFTEHLCLFACIIEGRKQLDKESQSLIKKYCKKRNKKYPNLDSIENHSIDTGRASSLASTDGDASFLSPPFSFSPFSSSSSIIMKPTKDASSSPPPGVKTTHTATSPIIFEERLSEPLIETCESQMLEDNTWNMSSSHIQLNNTSNLMEIDMTATTMTNPKTLDMSTGSIEYAVSIPVDNTIPDTTSPKYNGTQVPMLKQQKLTILNATNANNEYTVVFESKMPENQNLENNDAEVINVENAVAETIRNINSPECSEANVDTSKKSETKTITDITSPEHKETEGPISKILMAQAVKDVTSAACKEDEVAISKLILVKTITDITSPYHKEAEVPKSKKSAAKTITDITSPERMETEVVKSKMTLVKTITDITSPYHKEAEVPKSKKSAAKTITDITSPEHMETEVAKSKKTSVKTITDITSPKHKETEGPISKILMAQAVKDVTSAACKEDEVAKSKLILVKTITDITSPYHKEAEVPKSKKSAAKTITDITSPEHMETEVVKSKMTLVKTITDIISPYHKEAEVPKSKKSAAKTITDITSPEHMETDVAKSKKTSVKTITDITSPKHKETEGPISKILMAQAVKDVTSAACKEDEVAKSKLILVKTITDITSPYHKEAEVPKSKMSAAKSIKVITSAEQKENEVAKSKKSTAKTITDITSPEHKEIEVAKCTFVKTFTNFTGADLKETKAPKSKNSMPLTIQYITSAENNDSPYFKSKKFRNKSLELRHDDMKEPVKAKTLNLSNPIQLPYTKTKDVSNTSPVKQYTTRLSDAMPKLNLAEGADTETRVTRSKTLLTSPENQGDESPRITRSNLKITSSIEQLITTTRTNKTNTTITSLINPINACPRITRSKSAITSPAKNLNYKDRRVIFRKNNRSNTKLSSSINHINACPRITRSKSANTSPVKNLDYKDRRVIFTKDIRSNTKLSSVVNHINACPQTTRSKSAISSPVKNLDYKDRRVIFTEDIRSNTKLPSVINHLNACPRTTRSKSAFTSPVKNLEYKDRRVIFTEDISVLCETVDLSKLIPKLKILDIPNPTESSVSRILATPTKTSTVSSSEGAEIETLTVKHKSDVTSPIAHDDTARLTRSRSKTLNISLSPIKSFLITRKTRSKTDITRSVVGSDTDPRTPDKKSQGLTSPIKSSNVETPVYITRTTSPKKHTDTRRSLFKEDSVSEMDTSPVRKIMVSKKAQKRTSRVIRSNSNNFSITENNDSSTRTRTRSNSGQSPLMQDIRTLSEFKTGDTKTNMANMKTSAIANESCDKRVPLVKQKMDTTPPVVTLFEFKTGDTKTNMANMKTSAITNESCDKRALLVKQKMDTTPPAVTLPESKTGDTKTNMANMKTSVITNESCDKRAPLVKQKKGTTPPAVRLNLRSSTLQTGIVSPVNIVNIRSSESSVTTITSPIHRVGLRSPVPQSKTGITCLIEHSMIPPLSEFETDGAKTNMAKAKSPHDITYEFFDKRTPVVLQKMETTPSVIHSDIIRMSNSKTSIMSPVKFMGNPSESNSKDITPSVIHSDVIGISKTKTSIMSPVKFMSNPSELNSKDITPSVIHSDVIGISKSKTSIIGPVKFMSNPSELNSKDTTPLVMQSDSMIAAKSKTDIVSPVKNKLSESNSITHVTSPIQSIDFRSPTTISETSLISPIEKANARESMSQSKTDYNKSIESSDTRPCQNKTKEITNSSVDSRSEKMLPKNTVDTNCDTQPIQNNVDSSIPVAYKDIAKKLKELQTLQSNNYHNDADNDLEINMILRKHSIDWAMISPLSLSPVDHAKKHFKSDFKDGTVTEQNKVNDELIESLLISDEDSEDDINRDESIIKNPQPVASRKDVEFGKINIAVENKKRDSRFEDDVFEPFNKFPINKTYGNKYKKMTKLQKIYKANVRKNIQLSPTMKKPNKPIVYSISPSKLSRIVTNKEKAETSAKQVLFKKPDAHVKAPKEKINNKDMFKKMEPKKTVGEPEPNSECRLSCKQRNSQPENNLITTECNPRETSSSIRSSFSRIRTNPLPQCGRKKQLNGDSEYIKPNLNTISEYDTSLSINESDNSNISFAIPSRKRISRVTKSYGPDYSSIRTNESANTKGKSDLNHNDFDSESPPTKKNKITNAEIEKLEHSNPPKKNKGANAGIEKKTKKNKVTNAETETMKPNHPPKKNKVINTEIETMKPSNPPEHNNVANAEIETVKPSIPPQQLQDSTTECVDIEIFSSHNKNSSKDKEHQYNSPNNTATVNDSNSLKDYCSYMNKTTKVPDFSNDSPMLPAVLPPSVNSRHCADYNDMNIFTSQDNMFMNDINMSTSQDNMFMNDSIMSTSQDNMFMNDINMSTSCDKSMNNINMSSSQNDMKQQSLLVEQWTQNILDSMILKYGSNIKKFKKPEYKSDLSKKIEKGIANCVKHSQEPDKYSKSVQQLACEIKYRGQQGIIRGLMSFLNEPSRKKEIPKYNRHNRHAPTATKTEMVLIDLIESLENLGLSLWELVLDSSEYILFTLERGATPGFDVVESVAHFYANVCKYLRKTSRLWMFMLNAMYCLSFKAIPLIKHCLDVQPNLLPYANRYIDPGLAPVIRCFVFLLHYYNCEDPFKRVEELRLRLRNIYYYQLQDENETTILFMVKQCISNLPDRKLNRDMLELVLLILGKRRGTRWCHKNIVQKILLPMIKGEIDVSYAGKRFCISTIGNIVKPYKHEMTVYSEEVVNLLLNMFETTLSHDIKEDVVRSLINMNMKAMSERINKCLLNWNPPTVSPALELVLKDYVQSRQVQAWQFIHQNQLS